MRPLASSPTLLVFTLGAQAECERRPLLPRFHRRTEVELRRSCLDAALRAGRRAGCHLEVSSPDSSSPVGSLPTAAAGAHCSAQPEGGFGERLAASLGRTLDRTRGPVVLVGTDVPGLQAGHVRQALALLAADTERVVLGPSPDGGLYLLATSRPIPGLAAGVRWCSRNALASLRRLLAAAGRPVVLLEPLNDLDGRSDLERWLAARREAATGWQRLVGLLRRLLADLCRPLSPRPGGPPPAGFVPVRGARGPPLVTFA